jgi:hypothetical protein
MNEFREIKNDYIVKIKELIFFDECWMFPEYSIIEYLKSYDDEIPIDFIEIGNKIVNILNSKNINIEDFDLEFDNIVKIN